MHDDNQSVRFIGSDKDVNPYPSPNSVPVTATRITDVNLVITQTTSAMLESFRAEFAQSDAVIAMLMLAMLVIAVAASAFVVRRKNG